MPNAKRIGRIIESDSTRHFKTPRGHGDHLEARKLGSLRVEAEIRRFCIVAMMRKKVTDYLLQMNNDYLSNS